MLEAYKEPSDRPSDKNATNSIKRDTVWFSAGYPAVKEQNRYLHETILYVSDKRSPLELISSKFLHTIVQEYTLFRTASSSVTTCCEYRPPLDYPCQSPRRCPRPFSTESNFAGSSDGEMQRVVYRKAIIPHIRSISNSKSDYTGNGLK